MKTLLFVLALSLSQLTSAALYDRGNGLIYDDVLDITWTQNANINGVDIWANHVAWVAGGGRFVSLAS